MKNVLLGVTSSIAAYKTAELANVLTKKGYTVDVVMTENATRFIAPLTFQALTKRKVHVGMFEDDFQNSVEHISLAKRADLCLIAPATANFIGKLASGIADDMLTTVVMAIKSTPVYICPAMNTAMYENSIVQENIQKLIRHGYQFIEPREALLACGDLGKGALAEVDVIITEVLHRLQLL